MPIEICFTIPDPQDGELWSSGAKTAHSLCLDISFFSGNETKYVQTRKFLIALEPNKTVLIEACKKSPQLAFLKDAPVGTHEDTVIAYVNRLPDLDKITLPFTMQAFLISQSQTKKLDFVRGIFALAVSLAAGGGYEHIRKFNLFTHEALGNMYPLYVPSVFHNITPKRSWRQNSPVPGDDILLSLPEHFWKQYRVHWFCRNYGNIYSEDHDLRTQLCNTIWRMCLQNMEPPSLRSPTEVEKNTLDMLFADWWSNMCTRVQEIKQIDLPFLSVTWDQGKTLNGMWICITTLMLAEAQTSSVSHKNTYRHALHHLTKECFGPTYAVPDTPWHKHITVWFGALKLKHRVGEAISLGLSPLGLFASYCVCCSWTQSPVQMQVVERTVDWSVYVIVVGYTFGARSFLHRVLQILMKAGWSSHSTAVILLLFLISCWQDLETSTEWTQNFLQCLAQLLNAKLRNPPSYIYPLSIAAWSMAPDVGVEAAFAEMLQQYWTPKKVGYFVAVGQNLMVAFPLPQNYTLPICDPNGPPTCICVSHAVEGLVTSPVRKSYLVFALPHFDAKQCKDEFQVFGEKSGTPIHLWSPENAEWPSPKNFTQIASMGQASLQAYIADRISNATTSMSKNANTRITQSVYADTFSGKKYKATALSLGDAVPSSEMTETGPFDRVSNTRLLTYSELLSSAMILHKIKGEHKQREAILKNIHLAMNHVPLSDLHGHNDVEYYPQYSLILLLRHHDTLEDLHPGIDWFMEVLRVNPVDDVRQEFYNRSIYVLDEHDSFRWYEFENDPHSALKNESIANMKKKLHTLLLPNTQSTSTRLFAASVLESHASL